MKNDRNELIHELEVFADIIDGVEPAPEKLVEYLRCNSNDVGWEGFTDEELRVLVKFATDFNLYLGATI